MSNHDVCLAIERKEAHKHALEVAELKKKISELEDHADQEFLRGAEVGDATAVRARHENDVLLKLLYGKIHTMHDALKVISGYSTDAHIACNGRHTDYSSMHPNADKPCPYCGESEDSRGGSIRKSIPTREAKIALEALEKVK